MRTVEEERRDNNVKTLAAFRAHRIGAAHHAGRRRQRRAGRIAENLAGFDHRRFADNACAANFLDLAAAVGDLPKPVRDGEVFAALIIDFNGIGPDETRV